MRSDAVKSGFERAPHRSLFYATGLTPEELAQPIIGVVNSFNEIVPGHAHLNTISDAVKAGIRHAGGTPMEFNVIGVCDREADIYDHLQYTCEKNIRFVVRAWRWVMGRR